MDPNQTLSTLPTDDEDKSTIVGTNSTGKKNDNDGIISSSSVVIVESSLNNSSEQLLNNSSCNNINMNSMEKMYNSTTKNSSIVQSDKDSGRTIKFNEKSPIESNITTIHLETISSSNSSENNHVLMGENLTPTESNIKQYEEQVPEHNNEKLDGESIIRVRERRISRRIVVNTNFQALTTTTSNVGTPVIHNVDIFDDSEVENDTSTCSSVDEDDGIVSNVKDGYFENFKESDILSVKSSDTEGILMNSNGSVLKVNEAVNYYPSVNEMNNEEKSKPKIYSSIIFESKHDHKRIQLFESIVSNYEEYVTKNPNQFRKLIREGIPTKDLLRTVWKRMVGSEEISNKYPGLYKKLTMHGDILEDDVHKIMKDVHRTYPQYEFFSEKDGPGQQSLIRILKAYCHFDKQTGYCQGMAFICGFALMNLEDEEDTFWFFVQIMNNNKHGLKDIFAEGLPRLRLVMFMVSELIKLRLPDIHKNLEENYILPEMYASSILMTLCTNRFSFASSQRIWSIFLNEGWKM